VQDGIGTADVLPGRIRQPSGRPPLVRRRRPQVRVGQDNDPGDIRPGTLG
jgi:hypothetical protein